LLAVPGLEVVEVQGTDQLSDVEQDERERTYGPMIASGTDAAPPLDSRGAVAGSTNASPQSRHVLSSPVERLRTTHAVLLARRISPQESAGKSLPGEDPPELVEIETRDLAPVAIGTATIAHAARGDLSSVNTPPRCG
jgi:hypothetical protein